MTIHIQSLSVSAGFLKDAPVSFSKGLTCIIGTAAHANQPWSRRFAFALMPTLPGSPASANHAVLLSPRCGI